MNMQYREIVAVTGLGGLYQLLSTKSDGAIVRSLADNATKFISSRQHNVTPLESIEIYTTGNNVRLHEVLQKMKESTTARPDVKKSTPDGVRGYFKSVFPEMDEDRVYASDMKKMLKWYEILEGANLLDFTAINKAVADEAAANAAEDANSMPAEGKAQVKEHSKAGDSRVPLVEEGEAPAKKARAKKAAASEEGEGEKPVKKAAAKKKSAEAAEGEDAAPKKTAKAKKPKEEGNELF
jgi:hypothetical protein